MAMDEAAERMMMQLENIKIELQQYQQQRAQMMMTAQEMASAKVTIEALKNASKDNEIMIPIGGGIFIKGKVTDPSTIIASVGADVAVTKDLQGAIVLIDERMKMIDDSMKKLEEVMTGLEMQAQKIYEGLEKASSEQGNGKK